MNDINKLMSIIFFAIFCDSFGNLCVYDKLMDELVKMLQIDSVSLTQNAR